MTSALDVLQKLLGQGENGKKWRAFLLLDPVAAELAKGPDKADPAAIARSWARLASKASGLDRPQCVAVREAMAAWWSERLAPADGRKIDRDRLEAVAAAAKSLFVDVGPAAVEHDRRALAAAIKVLKAHLAGGKAPDGFSAADLDLDSLEAQLALQEPASDGAVSGPRPDLARLKAIEDVFWARKAFLAQSLKLDRPVYLDVGDAVRQYRRTLLAKRLNNRDQALRDDRAAALAEANRFERYAEKESRGTAMFARLHFAEFKTAIAAPQPDVSALRRYAASFAAPLEEVEKVNAGRGKPLAAALARYCDLAGSPADYTRLRVDFEQAVTGLGNEMATYQSSLATEDAAAVNARLAWLVDHEQAYPLRLALRPLDKNANVMIEIAQPLAAIGIARRLENEPIAIRDTIMGTSIQGSGMTTGDVGVSYVPDARLALLVTTLRATTTTNTVGWNGPATIYATGATRLSGDAIIEMDAAGVRWRKPSVNASTSTRIDGVATRSQLRLVQRIAARKVAESKPRAEQVSARHAARRASERLDQELAQTIGKANRNYLDKFRGPLMVRRAFPQPLSMSTSQDWITVSAVQAQPPDLAAIDAPPPIESGAALRIRLHESAINNWAEAMFAGATITKDQIDDLKIPGVGAAQQEEPDDCKEDEPARAADAQKNPADAGTPAARNPDEPPKQWKIVFADERPITVSIRDDGFSVTLRVRSIESGDNSAEHKIIRAEYKVARRCDGIRLTRQSLTVTPFPGTPNESGRQAKIKNRLQELAFPETKVSNGLLLPGEWKKAGKLPLRHLKLAAGWASLAWDLPAGRPSLATAVR